MTQRTRDLLAALPIAILRKLYPGGVLLDVVIKDCTGATISGKNKELVLVQGIRAENSRISFR